MKKRMLKQEVNRLQTENQRLSRTLSIVTLALTLANFILTMSRMKQIRKEASGMNQNHKLSPEEIEKLKKREALLLVVLIIACFTMMAISEKMGLGY